jgi:NADPH2:quinone reductase
MKAVALTHYLPIDDAQSLVDVELPRPSAPSGHDLLVRVEAISVNPVDTKLRAPKPQVEAQPRVLGYDAAGVVEGVGEHVTGFQPGDRVYYAGDVTRPGSNAQYQLVDSRLVGHAPKSIELTDVAALPLTTITAWELLFQRMPFDSEHGGEGKSLLIIAGAGGVGSIAIQLARRAGFIVIATASRAETISWCQSMGAHHVIDHRQPVPPQLAALGFEQVDAVLNLADTERYWKTVGEILAPQGHVGLIVEPSGGVNIGDPYKAKCIGIHWEMMFARPARPRRARPHSRARGATDRAGELRSTRNENLGAITAENLREAHRRLESGSSIGKHVLAGW